MDHITPHLLAPDVHRRLAPREERWVVAWRPAIAARARVRCRSLRACRKQAGVGGTRSGCGGRSAAGVSHTGTLLEATTTIAQLQAREPA